MSCSCKYFHPNHSRKYLIHWSTWADIYNARDHLPDWYVFWHFKTSVWIITSSMHPYNSSPLCMGLYRSNSNCSHNNFTSKTKHQVLPKRSNRFIKEKRLEVRAGDIWNRRMWIGKRASAAANIWVDSILRPNNHVLSQKNKAGLLYFSIEFNPFQRVPSMYEEAFKSRVNSSIHITHPLAKAVTAILRSSSPCLFLTRITWQLPCEVKLVHNHRWVNYK